MCVYPPTQVWRVVVSLVFQYTWVPRFQGTRFLVITREAPRGGFGLLGWLDTLSFPRPPGSQVPMLPGSPGFQADTPCWLCSRVAVWPCGCVASRWPQVGSRWPHVGLKLASCWLKLASSWPKMASCCLELAQDGLMLPRVGPSWLQVGSSWLQVGSSWTQDQLLEPPAGSPGGSWEAPGRVLGGTWSQEALLEAPEVPK